MKCSYTTQLYWKCPWILQGRKQLWAVCGPLPRIGTGLESCPLHLSSHLYIKWLIFSLQRLSSLWWQQQQSWGKLQKPFHMLTEISLEMGIFGEIPRVMDYLFLTFLLEKGLDEGKESLELEEYRVLLSQAIGQAVLFKWRLMLWKLGVCATCSGKRQDEGQAAVVLRKLWVAWGRDGHKTRECSCS